jgi:hypothetical protein
MTRARLRVALLALGLTTVVGVAAGDGGVRAQEASRDDSALALAGRKIRVDKNSGKLRDLSQQEARELIATLTTMTTRTEQVTEKPGSATLVQMKGFDHVLVGRPNEDGTVDVRCVSSVDDAVSFLSQTPKSQKE